jgi:NAD(P)H dehydrogenase (quinone)
MRVSVILAHPDTNIFNHAIAQAAVAQLSHNIHHAILHDLYAERFDPLLLTEEIPKGARLSREIELHCQELSCADGIIIIHPNWWGQPPAILKGWIDRVIRPGVAYQFLEGDQGEGIPSGLLQGKRVLIFNTSNTPPEREAQVFSDPLEILWKQCIFGLCGIDIFYREMFSVVVTSTLEQRQSWLRRVEGVVGHYFPTEKVA